MSVSGGQTTNEEAKLQVKSQNEPILVTAPRLTGEAEAINIERTADNLVQVLPAEVIRSSPTQIWRMPSAACPV